MNNITKYILVFLLVVAVIFGGYYYFQYIGELNDNLEPIEEREEQRTVDIDSIQKQNERLLKSIDSLTLEITKLEKYEPPKVDNSDIIPRNIRYKDSLLSVYYPNN